jgi:hypothetical protein
MAWKTWAEIRMNNQCPKMTVMAQRKGRRFPWMEAIMIFGTSSVCDVPNADANWAKLLGAVSFTPGNPIAERITKSLCGKF